MNPMTDDPLDYFRQWLPPRSGTLQRLEDEARSEQIPIVGPVVGKLLYMIARIKNARTILELGTATGYSALHLAEACRHTGGRIITVETDDALARRARENIAREGLSHTVEVRCAEALSAVAAMQGPVDMIFMDIEKKEYVRALPACTRLMAPGGVLLADNTGFREAHAFNRAIFGSTEWEVVNLWSYLPYHSPEHDGICLAVKR